MYLFLLTGIFRRGSGIFYGGGSLLLDGGRVYWDLGAVLRTMVSPPWLPPLLYGDVVRLEFFPRKHGMMKICLLYEGRELL